MNADENRMFNGALIGEGTTRVVNGWEEWTLAKAQRTQRKTDRDQMAQNVWLRPRAAPGASGGG